MRVENKRLRRIIEIERIANNFILPKILKKFPEKVDWKTIYKNFHRKHIMNGWCRPELHEAYLKACQVWIEKEEL